MLCRFKLSQLFCSAAIAVLPGLIASSANATCGDWLAHSDDDGGSAHSRRDVKRESAKPTTAPCRGPYCGKAPLSSAPISSVADATAASKQLVASHLGWRDRLAPSFTGPHDNGPLPRRGFPARLECPPRV